MSDRYDVIVVGAGPAGSAAATLLARAGRAVVLLDRDTFPRDKLCGEFLSGEAADALAVLGAASEVSASDPARIEVARLSSPSGRIFEVQLPRPGLGVSRRVLDAALVHAAEHAGAVLRERHEVVAWSTTDDVVSVTTRSRDSERTVLHAPLVIVACGRATGPSGLVGVKRHHRFRSSSTDLRGVVEIHAFDGGYCGVSQVESDLVNVCALLRLDGVRDLATPGWDGIVQRMARSSGSLGARLATMVPAEPGMHAASGIALAPRASSASRLFFAGDAVGMIAPFCGAGQAMALRSGMLLAETLLAFSDVGDAEREWAQRSRDELRVPLGLGRLLQPLLMHRALSEVAIRVMARVPGVARWVARRTRGG